MSHSPSLLGLRVLWLCVFLLFPALVSATPSVTIGRFGPGTVDGTAPFNVLGSCADTADQRIDGEDCGEGNGVVRTQDSVSHIWSITADGYDPGAPNLKNVVLEQTITPSTNAVIQFDSLPVACTPKAGGGTTPASAIVDNGSGSWKLTCNLGEFSEGQQKSLTVNVKISGKSWNGSDYTSSQRVYSMAEDGVTENATGATYADVGPIKISAQPAYDLVHSINTTHGFYEASTGVRAVKDLNGDGVINTADNEAGYYTYSLIRLAAARKTGIEAINQPIVFKDTFKATALAESGADFPLEFYVTECRDNPSGWGGEVFGSKSYYPSYDNYSYKYHALDSGTCQLVRDTPTDPTSVAFTATLNNVDLSGTHYPTLGFGGVDYSAGPYYAADYRVQFFIPFRSIDMTDGAMDDQGSVYLSSVLSGFDPNGLSGTSNYGTDLEPGYDGAPMNGLRGNNRLGPTEYLLTIRGSFNKRNIKNVDDAVTAYTYTSPSSWHGGDGEMEPEQFYAGWVHYVNNGTKSLENPMSCDVFDNTVQRLTDRGDTGGTAGTYAYVGTYAPNGFDYRNYVVEYGHIDLTGDDPLDRNHDGTKDYDITTGRYHGDWAKARAARCDDGVPVGGWFTDPTQVPGGIDEVNATRVRLTDTAKAAGVAFDPGHEMRFVVPLKIRDKFHSGPYAGQTIPVGTVAANFGGVRADNWKAGGTATALGSWTARNYDASPETGDTDGDRVTISRIKMTLDSESLEPVAIPGNTANTLAGSQIVWKVNTAVQSTLPKPSAAENLQIIDELPPEATYNGSCTTAQAGGTPPSLVEYNTDRNGNPKPGYTRLLWNFGNVTANTIIPPRIFCTDTDPLAPNGTSVVNYAEMRADNVITALSARSDIHSIRLEQTGSIQVAKKVDMPLDDLNDDQVYTLSWANFAPAFKIDKPTIIDVLPFLSGGGDGADAKSARTPASNFHGKLVLTAAPTITWLDGSSPTGADSFPTLGDWYYSADAPETINYNPDENAAEGTTNWCLEAAFGTAGCPTDFAAVTALKFVAHYDLEKDGNPRKGMTAQFTLQAGDTSDPNSANANKPGDLYTNRFAFDTTSIDPPQFLRSNNVSVQVAAYSIGDFIFADNNQNGLYDVGVDAPAPDGITVDLYDSADKKVATTTTGVLGAGRFLFEPLASGQYYIKIPAGQFQSSGKLFGWQASVVPDGATEEGNGNETVDQHGYAAGALTSTGIRTGLITLSANPPPPGGVPTGNEPMGDNAGSITDPTGDDFSNLTLDIGLVPPPASLGDTVWNDVNQNGMQDVGEQGLSNVLVKLLDKDGVELKNLRTDSAGKYEFTNLSAGSYYVEVVRPAGYSLSAKDQGADDTSDSDMNPVDGRSALITLGFGVHDPKVDAGLFRAASIGDRVWLDANGDAVQDASETTNLANVTILLQDSAGNTLDTTDTDTNGAYLFSGLQPGNYKVKIDTTDADLVGYTLTTDNNPHSVTLAEGQAYVDADFGFVNFASVGDRVWEDRNGNGIQDDGEPGIAGVTVRLLDSTGTTVVKTTTTDASGLYLFSNVTPGNYLLEFAKPDGFAGFVTASQGADLAKSSDADVLTGRTATFTLSGGATLRDFDAGLYRAASVGDLLWFDANGNGMQDVGEPGVAGTTVTLSGTRGDGAALAAISKTTDASGVYAFEDLYPGNYTVTFSLPAGMTFTSQNQGANDAQDSDVGTDGITSAVVQSGEKNLTLDAGVRPAAVSGRVWIDNNVPNAQDDGISAEDGVVGVSVNLIDTTSGAVVATTTTGADGLYTFTGVLPGSYQVQVLEPANMGFVAQNQGGDDTKDSDVEVANGKSQVFTVSSGDSVTDLDAGIEPGRLGDRVWLDLNSNNLQDSGEPGVANVTVNLLDGSGAVVATQATDATGFYDFAAVLPGAYTVQFIAPAGMTLVTANQGTDDTLDSDPSADGKIAVTIVSGVGNQTVDAGILPAKLGDFAWLDRDADGTQGATEPPVVGMTVNLLDASGNPVNDMGGNPVTAVTDANGKYVFVVLPGTYRVNFNLPAGAVFSALDQGGNDAADSDAVLATGMTPVVTLASGDENLTLDAGLAITSVSGFVIEDRNANGTQDSGETGIAGVTLTLTGTDVFGNPVAALTTTTDANGFYRFDKLAPGTYAVSETNPANYVSSASLPGNAVGAAVVDADALTTPALGGTPSENNNFLDYRLGSIAGQVREDVDYDGELADADSGMAGVTVTLFTDPNGDGNPADGVEVATTTTNSSGAYLFNALTPGNYTVVETDFAQWQSTADTQGTNDNRIPVVLASAEASTGNDFLDAKQQGGLSGVVWTDTNTDGVRDATETGIPSVTVKVLDTNGTVVATLITDSSGVYTAANLPPGDYRVQLDPATLPAGMQQTGDPDGLLDHQTNAEVKPAQVTSGLDFGYVGNVFLGDFVWHDLNANGIQDAGEPGLAGVTATLYLDGNGNGLAESGEQLQSVVTPATGAYAFHDLLPLDYLVNFTLPNGYLRSPQNQGADDAKDSDADANGQAAVSLKTGTNATIDAGFYQLGQLGDYVWLDADANGVQDAAEPVIAGMAVQLLDAAGVQLASTTTDANGRYVFADLPPAAYGVKFTAPAGMSFTSALQGGDTALDSDVDGSGMANATLVSGTNLLTVDAGITPAAITGRVWIDNDTPNATDDGVEAGVVGVGVNLIDTNTGNVVATTTTGADGIYRFIGVLPGDYQVQVIEPANMGFVKQDQGGDDSKDSDVTPTDGKSQVFTVTSGNTVSDIDAGIEPGALGDRVWLDSNGNNLQDSGEPGIANITVNLLDGNGAVVATQITDATGFYNFAAVLPGDYTVQFVVPAGMTLVTANQGLDDTLDSDPAAAGKIAVTIVSGVGNQTVDAGIVPAKLGDYVWQDLNGDGKQDAAEPVVAGLVVNLLDKDGKPMLDVGGNAITTTTAQDGKYQFMVLPGEYRVGFSLPTGVAATTVDQGGDDAADSDADPVTLMTPAVTLVSAAADVTLDLGLAPATVSGYVIDDANANGVQDTGERVIVGVTVTLSGKDAFGVEITETTTTDANGLYSFTVPAGQYTLKETNPADYVSSGSKAGSAAGASVIGMDEVMTPVAGGSTSERNDFFDYRVGSIAGQVRDDANYNGALTDTETGIPGVTMTLLLDDVEVAQTATDSQGNYLFSNLKPGNYVIVETDLALWDSTADIEGANDNRVAVTLASAQHSTGNDFLDSKQKGSLSGVVWTDTDTDGVRDAEETGIPNMTVKVLDSNGSVVATLTTDNTGAYTAADLPPGNYTVQIDPATLPAGTQQTGDPDAVLDHQTTAEVMPMQVTSSLDFGYVGNVFLGDRVWHDLNANGIQDDGEPGLVGVTVMLYRDANGNAVAEPNEQLHSVVTPASGAYLFPNLLPLDYLVKFTLPNGYLRSPQNQGADDGKDSDTDANGQVAVSLKTGANATIDAGFYQLAKLGDYVWLDANANGVQDAAEPLMAGVEVQLLDSAAQTLATTVTDSNGNYVFSDLTPTAYSVKFVAPIGMSFTTAKQGTDAALDSDADSNGLATVTLSSGETQLGIDAGITPAAISGRVWIDNNTPNAQDEGIGTEAGVVGVGVNLIDVKTGKVVATTTTGADGIYRFIGVLPGDYQVQVLEPANMGFVTQDQGGDDSKDSDVTLESGKSHTFSVTSGDSITDVDAGIEPGALGDRVWLDSNGNNLQDSSEPGIANIAVNLLDSNGAVVATQITDATGFYNFAAVLPGDYTVQFVVPAGMTLVTANQGLDDTLDSDPAADGKIAVTIVSGVGNQTVDAGIVPAKLGDYVWQDLNGNGKQDAAEPVVAGLVVNLLDKDGKPMLDVGGNAITTATAQDGKYQFMVLPGEYRVGFSLPTGVAATTVDQGGDDAADSDADPATLMTPAVTLVSAAADVTLDLGLAPATVSGYVIDDANANGVQDTGERVIVGVTVTLSGKDTFGVEITETTTTDANGLYSFTVPAGQYTLKETNPADYISSGSKAGSAAGATVIGMDEVMTPVAGGSTSERNDFFDYRVGSIAGQVRDDANYNGALTDTETGIPGVTMILLLDDVEVAQTATDSQGNYLFSNLKPGNYVIVETDLALWSSTADIDATNDNRVAVTLASAQHSTGNDFLDSKQKGSLSGVVWTDTNSDGVRDGGESVLAGVSVTVLDSSGNPVATLTTDAQGAYSAADLPPGTYTVNVDPASLPAGSQQTGDPDGVKDHQTLAVIKPSQNTSGLDFGYATLVALGDKVWHDLNANGVQDAEEPGLAGVMVALYRDANNNGSPDADEQVKAVLTDGTGAYLFSKLLPVDYLVTFSVPTGYERSPVKQGGNGDKDSDADANGHVKVSLINGATLAVDAGFYQRGRLGDYVWLDANQNGLQEANEPAITGMTVNLLDSNGATVASTTTDAAGFYQFDKLIPGNYQVEWVAPQGIVFTQQDVVGDDALDSDANSSGIAPVVLASGQTIASVDAGILPAAVSGRVWIDRNANGLDDAAEEAGVPGVRVNLLDAKTGAVVATTTTGGDGEYNFTGILPGDYLVETVQPATMVFVTPDQGDDDTRDSDVQVASGRSPSFVLNSSTSVTDVDAGIQPGELGDHVWLDQNNNGLQDAGEAGIGNVTVNLLDGSGNVVATQATDATGFYNFTGVLPGDYSVQFVLPQGAQFTASNNGSDDALDSDVDAAGKVAVTVISTVGNQTVDAGIVPATISGTVLDDRNANGVQNDDDIPVSGVVVTVTGTDVLGNPVTLETTTDTAGHYSIAMPPGTYTVTETNPSTAVSTGSEAGTQGSTVVDKDAISVTVNSGQVSANNDFLDYMPARLSGQVRDDANGNGVLSDAENGIASISVSLWLGDTLVATEMTDTNGVYVFENVQPGTYSVRETDRNGWLSTADMDGANDNTVSVTLASGDDKPGHDFLDTYPVNITGQVRDDTDRDGDLNDTDTGMPGVTVTLLLDGKPVQTTITNDNGEYSFAAVPPGDYVITTTDPSPYAPSGDVDGGQDARIAVTVFSGTAVVDQDLLYANMQGSLGDWVWLDRNNDSLQDSSEPVLAGITVVLSGKDTAGNAVNLSTATDATGKYLFAKLVPGVYTIEYQLPLGMRLTLPNQGDNEALDSDPEILSRQVTVTLAAGEHNHNVDAGVRPASVSGALWEDRNGDGLLTRGEAPLASVPVALFTDPNGDGNPADGVQVGTTNSGVDGVYGFDGLMPGTYVVVVSPPSGYVPVPPNQGTDPAINSSVLVDRRLPVTLESGETVDKNGGFYVLGSVGDRLWLDLNGNGKQDSEEPGIRDVALALLNQAGEPVMNMLNPELPYRVVSDVNGAYRFDNLLPGQYFVQLEGLAGFVLTQTDAGTDDALDSDANANGRMPALVQSGLHNPDVDAGLLPASVTGRVWIDHNSSNGIDDGLYPEPGAVGIVVNLLDKDGKLVATTTTGVDGIYSFSGVLPGDYQLEFVTPNSMTLVAANQGEDDTRDSDADVETGRSPLFTVTSSTGVQDMDAGIQAGTLGDRVWVDLNANGLQDSGEPGVAGVTVKLLDSADEDVALTTTDASGFYAFRDVIPGTYTVQFVLAADIKLTATDQGDDDALDSDADPATGKASALVGSGALGNQTVDAGILPAKIGDYVWLDANKNGVQDEGEMPLANVTVLLLDADGEKVASTSTDNAGNYQFSVPAGTYSVQVVAMDSAFTTAKQGDNAERDSDVDNSGATPLTTFTSGTTNVTLDAGILPASISGKVVNDVLANGTVEPSDGVIANVTVTLSGTDSFGNPVNLTTVSAADGSYQFLVPPGVYTLTETQPQGYVSTGSSAGSGDGTVISHDQVQVTVASNAMVQNVNFLDYDPASYVVLSGKVVDDRNHNGQADAGENGLPGVDVTLFTDPNGDGDPADGVAMETAITDSSGSFTFNGMPPGQYVVMESDPLNYESTADSAGANDNRVPVTLVSGQVPPKPLFLDAKPHGSLSGQVLLDTDKDGDLADPDNGLAGINVLLFTDPNGDGNSDDGERVDAVLTDETGRYVFTNVIAGNWVIVAVDQAGYVSTADITTPNDNRIPVVVDVVNGANECRLPNGMATCTGLDFLDAPLNSGIQLLKTAYQGHDAGAKCGTDAAKTELTLVDIDKDKRENVTYCFEITNTGDNWLAQVALLDDTLGLTADKLQALGDIPALLAPLSKNAKARMRYYYEHVITAGIVNKASVTAKPALEDGTVLAGGVDTSSDSSVNVRFVFDPPTATKTVTATGEQVMLWQMVWINSSSDSVAGVEIYDGVPAGTYYAAMQAGAHVSSDGVYCETRGSSRTDICRYEAPSAEFPRGRVFWKGTIGADLGNATEQAALNEVVIRFYSVLNKAGDQQTIENQASSSWDLDADGKPEYADFKTDNGSTDDFGDSTSISIGAPAQIPTLGEWALWMLSLLMVLVAFGYRRKAR